jgi:hypothetical protein
VLAPVATFSRDTAKSPGVHIVGTVVALAGDATLVSIVSDTIKINSAKEFTTRLFTIYIIFSAHNDSLAD